MKTQQPQGRLAHFLADAAALRPKRTRRRYRVALFIQRFGSFLRNTGHTQRRQSRAAGRPCVRRRSAHRARRATATKALSATDPPPGTELGHGGGFGGGL